MLTPGAILFEGLDKVTGTGHSAMAVSNTDVVHSTPPVGTLSPGGVIRETAEEVWDGEIAVFHCTEAAVSTEAIRLALGWADAIRMTPFSGSNMVSPSGYKEGRSLGITEANQSPELRKFGLDALYRVFKWAANNSEKHFSRNRGVTCAPFITACFQTAWVRYHFNFDKGAIQEMFDRLTSMRPAKAPEKDRVDQLHKETDKSGTKLGRRPFPQYARVAGDIPEDLWLEIAGRVKQLSGHVLTKPEDLVTPGLYVDAKFNSTRNFVELLKKDADHWQPLPAIQF